MQLRSWLLQGKVHWGAAVQMCRALWICSLGNMQLLSLTSTRLSQCVGRYHRDRIFGSFHFRADEQNKQACSFHWAGWSDGALPNPTLTLPWCCLWQLWRGPCFSWVLTPVGGRGGQASHLLLCPLFSIFLPMETGSVEVTLGWGPGPRGAV